jgi:putative spermidine/putrescine transport system ATP-binding protein
VLLLDEPLTALDAQLRETLRAEIDELLRSLRVTTVYVTHDQSEAMALGDRIAVMSAGRIEQIGTPQEVYRQPATPFVEGFIGTMNHLDGRHFRPEDASLAEPSGSDGTGRVVSSFFLGDHARVIVETAAGHRITLRADARTAPSVGETVGIRIHRENHSC